MACTRANPPSAVTLTVSAAQQGGDARDMREVRDGDVVAGDAPLRFSVTAARAGFVEIVSLDERGVPRRYAPFTRVEAGASLALGGAPPAPFTASTRESIAARLCPEATVTDACATVVLHVQRAR